MNWVPQQVTTAYPILIQLKNISDFISVSVTRILTKLVRMVDQTSCTNFTLLMMMEPQLLIYVTNNMT